MCRNSTNHILIANRKKLGDQHILVAKTLAIWKAVVPIIQKQKSEVVIESDSLNVIQAIRGDVIPPSQIRNLVEHINILAKVVKNIKFVYYSKSANELVDLIAKKVLFCYTNLIYECFSFPFCVSKKKKTF